MPRKPIETKPVEWFEENLKVPRNTCLYCTRCQATYSAHKGDYFTLPTHYVIKCCGRPVKFVRETTTYSLVTEM